MDKFKKKLTLTGKIKQQNKSIDFSDKKNKRSVLVEKKVHRGKSSGFSSRFGNKNFANKNTKYEGSINQKKPNTNLTRPQNNKSFELRKLAEQKAKKRIKNIGLEEDKGKKSQDKSKNFGSKREYKLTISRALEDETSSGRERSLASVRRARLKEKKLQFPDKKNSESKKVIRDVNIPDVISIQELSNRMAEQASSLIKHLLNMGVTATINHKIDADTAEYLVKEFGHVPIREIAPEATFSKAKDEEGKILKNRPPIVTIMGHVDHGKTSILDAMRQTNIVSQEYGGITQHIGAYQSKDKNGKIITFIDTPGHAAFTEMRARGSKVTDIVVLVVAADDGVKPQTVEAIKHAKSAKVPIIVAINKCDLPGADAKKIKNQLLEYELISEELSGDTLFAEVSAVTKKNLEQLKEHINLQAELMNLKASTEDKAVGAVIESKIDKGRGPVSTVLITNGTLKKGDHFVCGKTWGKVRAMINHEGNMVEIAEPSTPVEVLGMNEVSRSGDEFTVVEDEGKAKEIHSFRIDHINEKKGPLVVAKQETIFEEKNKVNELSLVIKSDVHGSSEAIKSTIEKIKHDEVMPKIILSGVGLINESDVSLAQASNALIIGFNVKASKEAKKLAENYKLKINYFNIIYEIVDFITKSLSGMLEPEVKEEILGSAEILEIFKVSKVGKVAGSKVLEGEITSKSSARLIRDGSVLYTGSIVSIFREKNAAKQVTAGLECGITLKDFVDFKEKDVIEAYKLIKSERTVQ